MLEYNGKTYFAPGDKVYRITDITATTCRIISTNVERTTLCGNGKAIYTLAGDPYTRLESDVYAKKEDAIAAVESGQSRRLTREQAELEEKLRECKYELADAREDQVEAVRKIKESLKGIARLEKELKDLSEHAKGKKKVKIIEGGL